MSRPVERALEAVERSEFNFLNEKELEIRNAHIFWTNFEGRENRFKNATRNFNVAINEELAAELNKRGWRVRDVDLKGEGDEVLAKLYFVNCKVNMDSAYPPMVVLYSEYRGKRSRTSLDIESVSILDTVEIQMADLVINSYESPSYPGKVTGYLKKLNVIQEPSVDFGGKYDDWMEEEPVTVVTEGEE
jgi:hypothetical protein